MQSATRSNRSRSSRRRRWIGGAGIAIVVAGVLLLLIDAYRPRHAYFSDRQGALTDAVVEYGMMPGTTSRADTIRAVSDSGLAVSFRVLRPMEDQGPLPLVIVLGGHRTGQNAIEIIGDCGPVAVAALDYPYHGPEKLRGFSQVAGSIPEIRRALLDTPPAVSLALDWLVAQPWVDRERIELIGVSLGTPFAAVAGARDERFRRVWLIHGGADNHAWIGATLRKRIPNDALRSLAATSILLLARGGNFDTAAWVAEIAPRSVVVVGAREDTSLTNENVEALYTAAGEPRLLLWTDGPHINPRRPELVRPILDIVLERVHDALPGGPDDRA